MAMRYEVALTCFEAASLWGERNVMCGIHADFTQNEKGLGIPKPLSSVAAKRRSLV